MNESKTSIKQLFDRYISAKKYITMMCVFDRSNLVSTSRETSQGKWHLDSLEYGQEAVREKGHSSGDLWVTAEHRHQTSGSE